MTVFLLSILLVSCQKTVVEFSFKQKEITIDVGETITLEYELNTDNEVEFSLSKTNVVSIDENEVTGIGEGEVIITGTVLDTDKSDTIKIIVTKEVEDEEDDEDENPDEKVSVESVSLSGPTSGFKGETLRLSIEISPENATNKEVVWESLDESVATVNEVGVLTLFEVGSVEIKATVDGVSDTFRVTINPETVENNFFYELEYNGGNMYYKTRDEMVDDWISDFNEFNISRYTKDNLPMGAWELGNVNAFFYDEEYRDKWLWMAEYLAEVGSSTNKSAAAAIVSSPTLAAFEAASSNYKWAISYEVRGFIMSQKFTSNANWQSSDYSIRELKDGFWQYFIDAKQETGLFSNEGKVALPTDIYVENHEFVGWYDNPDFYGLPFEEVGRTMKLYARFDEINPVTNLNILNNIEEMLKRSEHQLEVEITPSNALIQELIYTSSDNKVVSVSSEGLIVALNEGYAEIIVTNYNGKVEAVMEVEVYPDNDLVLTFNNNYNGFINVNEEFDLTVSGVGKSYSNKAFSLNVKDSSILSLSSDSKFKALKAGSTEIEVLDGSEVIHTHKIIVQAELNEEDRVDQLLTLLGNANNAVVSGLNVIPYYTPSQEYSDPRYESVNAYLFDDFVVDETSYPADPTKFSNRLMDSVEFVLVHDTANLSTGLR